MVERDLLDSVRVLRQQGRSPKEIARALVVPPAVVAPLVRLAAAERSEAEGGGSVGVEGSVRAADLIGCWINPDWANGLTVRGQADWPGLPIRRPRHRSTWPGTWCLARSPMREAWASSRMQTSAQPLATSARGSRRSHP